MSEPNFSASLVHSVPFLNRLREGTLAAYEAQQDSDILWRLAELDRKLGNLPEAAAGYERYAELHPEEKKAQVLGALMSGTAVEPGEDVEGVIPFLLVQELASESGLQEIRRTLERKREQFAVAKIGHNAEERVDLDKRAAIFFRGDAELHGMTQELLRETIRSQKVLERLGLEPISGTREEVEAIAYASGGKYVVHRDNTPVADNGRVLTVVWFIHDEPKGFSGGDLLLHDEPPAGQGFTRIVPQRNSAVFFPSSCLHEVTPVQSTVDDVMRSRMVLNGWFLKP